MSADRVLKVEKEWTRPKRLSSLDDLQDAGFIPSNAAQGYAEIAQHYAIGVSAHVAALIAEAAPHAIPQNPVAIQYIPDPRELNTTPEELDDPIGDHTHSPVKGIVHRYPDRVLLKITPLCAVYCRFCFRREMVGEAQDILADSDIDAALNYIRANQEIWEVILTGGDPLILSPRRLKKVLDALDGIDHVRVVRIHSRIPIADPVRVDDEMLAVLAGLRKALYIVLHVNHAEELTSQSRESFKKLRQAGAILLSQSVLLKGVNNEAGILETLFRELICAGVKPYYLHHPDLAKGTSHFRVTLEEGRSLMRDLQGRVSGICLPRYVLDIPGGYGKVPVSHSYLEKSSDDGWMVEDYQGRKHSYKPRIKTAGDSSA